MDNLLLPFSLLAFMQHPPAASKICSKCHIQKPASAFTRNPVYVSGLQSYCRECTRTYEKERRNRPDVKIRESEQLRLWRAANRRRLSEQRRRSNLKHFYGISVADYDQFITSQSGGCAICGIQSTDRMGRRLAVDHDKETGTIRGLLCSNCNLGIGHFQHDTSRLSMAINYLNKDRK